MTVTPYRIAKWIKAEPGTFAVRNPRDHDDIIHLEFKHRGQADFTGGSLKIKPEFATNNTRPPRDVARIFVEVIDGEHWWVSEDAATHAKKVRCASRGGASPHTAPSLVHFQVNREKCIVI